MKRFVFAVHNHQPVGNFDHVIREAFEKSYKPFIELVFNLGYPKVCFHFSGILYEWLEKNSPQHIEMISEMIRREQIEILSGGYYEPILSIIPERDAVEQVNKLNEYILKRFDYVPQGLWLTERVYNPKIINQLVRCGIKYIVLDDTHILNSGIREEEVNRIFITENNLDKMYVFVINHNLRYLIPYAEPYKTIEYINKFNEGIFVFADDGEKFGLWPESYNLVYERAWLYKFFESLKNSNILMKRFSECLVDDKTFSKKVIYIPTTSYFEMTEWVLDSDSSIALDEFKKKTPQEFHRFIKGGIFESFFTKYYQSNLIHKRIFDISSKLEKNYDPIAKDYLYKAECNCGWWHGVFGGIYLPHIRHAIYENLLQCQKRLFNDEYIKIDVKDFDFDDKDEIEIETKNNYFLVSPSYGGSLIEFSSKNRCVNFSSVMNRTKESYHKKEIRDINGNIINKVPQEIIYDWHQRRMLLDHFITNSTTLDMFFRTKYPEQGDFIPQEYSYSFRKEKNKSEVFLSRIGRVWYNDHPYSTMIEKKISIGEFDGFDVEYKIKNLSEKDGEFLFLVEFVFGFSSEYVAPYGELENITEYIFYDNIRGNIKLNFSIPLKLWIFPIFTYSNSEMGLEKTYQGSVVGCILKDNFVSGVEKCFSIYLRVL